jgi:hypothetical protein
VRSVFCVFATLCLLGAGFARAPEEPDHRDLQSQLAAASPALPAKVAPRRFGVDRAPRDSGAPLFVITEAIPPLVAPPRASLPGAPGQPVLVVTSAIPARSSRGPPA